MLANRIFIKDLNKHIDTEVKIFCWIDVRRDQGKMVFFEFRDVTGYIQGVVLPNSNALETAKELRPEFIVEVTGKINQRPEKMAKKEIINGDIEIEVLEIKIISKAKTPPFEINEDTANVEEELRLKYRYLDLRTSRMKNNMLLRSAWINECRKYLLENNFTEIETPLLTESTPEGSRDFVVPSRLQKGKFYALPQSPQQYKQLLMVSGFDRYFQMARALRDEDLRADRGFEHTQIDIEMSFVTSDEVLDFVENMLIQSVEALGYTIKEKPFPRITYKESMEKYGADKFDMRSEEDVKNKVLAYAWVIDFPFFEKTDDGKWTFTHNPFSMPKAEFLNDHLKGENIENILSDQYDLICNGHEVGGGSIRAHDPKILEATYKIMGNTDEEIKSKIGHMLEAFEYGAPPHGGLALGVERNIMNLMQEDYLREVQAFPATRGGKTSVMSGPSEIRQEQLDEFGLYINKKDVT